MLKIKDNVDLKKLEKFGFQEQFGRYLLNVDDKEQNKRLFKIPENKDFVFLTCYDDTNEITLDFQDMEDYYGVNLDIIYDLIKADLVEKVED